MNPIPEPLVEGKFHYYYENNLYAEEQFSLSKILETQVYHHQAVVTSRIESGEFLNIKVNCELNQFMVFTKINVHRTLGDKWSKEISEFDTINQLYAYCFTDSTGSKNFTRSMSSKYYLTAPSASSSAFFLQSKRLDTSGRTSINFMASENVWSYDSAPQEKIVYLELKNREINDFKLNDKVLDASHYLLHHQDSNSVQKEDPTELYVSKHFNIPYLIKDGHQSVQIEYLKQLN